MNAKRANRLAALAPAAAIGLSGEPALANSGSISKDGFAWTCRLRPDVAWPSNRLCGPTRALGASPR